MTSLPELLRAAFSVQEDFTRRGWKFCFIGGVAVQRWGNPRFTQDVDITLMTGFGAEEDFIQRIMETLEPRRTDGAEFALRNRVLLARTASGVDIDIALGALPFEERSVERASLWDVEGGVQLRTCSAEDLIVHKVFACRSRDWDDVESILTRQSLKVNWAAILEELNPLLLLKEDMEALKRLDALVDKVRRRLGG